MTNNLSPRPKSPFASLGVTGGILGAILTIYLTYQTSGQVPAEESALLVGAAISSLVSAYGRIRADRKVKL